MLRRLAIPAKVETNATPWNRSGFDRGDGKKRSSLSFLLVPSTPENSFQSLEAFAKRAGGDAFGDQRVSLFGKM
jgi:hypothetical protein